MFFYEIHEPDDDLGVAVLLGHPEQFEPVDFFNLVKKARLLLKDAFEEESLPEAIANELQRTAGFIHVSDERLIASVSVGETDQDTFLVTEGPAERAVFVSRDDDDADDSDDEHTEDRPLA